MSMAPEIHESYKYLLGWVDVAPGPIVLPEGFSATALAKIIHHTLVKKASLLEDAHLVQILYMAWTILNDSYIPIDASPASTQTDPPAVQSSLDSSTQTPALPATRSCTVQTDGPPPARSSGSQTLTPAGPQVQDGVSQTVPRCYVEHAVQTEAVPKSLVTITNTAVQTDVVKLRTKWTQMRRRAIRATGSQTDRSPSPPLPPPPPPPVLSPLSPSFPSLPPPPPPKLQVESRPAETQTPTPGCKTSETQTLLPQALPGRRATSTQTQRLRPPWVVRLVRGAPPPPAERPPQPRRFHGRRLLRRGHDTAPPEIPLTAPATATATAAATRSPSARPLADPRLIAGSESGHAGRDRTRVESESAGSIASPAGQSGRRSRSESSGGEGDPPAPVPAPAVAQALDPATDPAQDPTLVPIRDPRHRPASVEPSDVAPLPAVYPGPAQLPTEEPDAREEEPLGVDAGLDREEEPMGVDTGLTAMLDTSHSFLSAPPPELMGGSG